MKIIERASFRSQYNQEDFHLCMYARQSYQQLLKLSMMESAHLQSCVVMICEVSHNSFLLYMLYFPYLYDQLS